MSDKLKKSALEYHRFPSPGKIEVVPTKALTTQKDLALAYSPGVAAACEEIEKDPKTVSDYTSRGNLVGVITNGTAVLGLGDIGPLASKPVMEGKAVLFKKFAGIDVFDIEINEKDPAKLVDIIAALEPTFGGLNLEDIKAPECFYVEEKLREKLNIPVFHDDQHGTAIIASAAVINGLHIVNKSIDEVRLVTSGAGAAGIACLDLLVSLGMRRENIFVTDRIGVVYTGRSEDMDARKANYAQDTPMRTLAEAIKDADIFLGVSVGGVVSKSMVASMASNPIILALANPNPEIMPEDIREVRSDALIATGRSDFPNQVNNVLCFPYMFRGALDVGATTVNEAMKKACVYALAELTRMETSDVASKAYGGETLQFGPNYLIPQPFDPRLPVYLAPAVAKAAMDSGVATRPIDDLDAYKEKMQQFVFRTQLSMKPIFDAAKKNPKRVVFAEGEESQILQAVQVAVDDAMCQPILIGRPDVIHRRIEKLGLRIEAGKDFEIVNIDNDPRFHSYWTMYHQIMERKGIAPDGAKAVIRSRPTAIASIMLKRGEADALICGVVGRYHKKLRYVLDIIGLRDGVVSASALSAIAMDQGLIFVCDTYVTPNPTAEEIAESTIYAAEKIALFGVKPKIALLSHSNFGSNLTSSAMKMRDALKIIEELAPHLEVEGEMHADAALSQSVREKVFPNSKLKGSANLFVMPSLDAAHIAFNMIRVIQSGVSIGPILLGTAMPAHILTPSATVRRIVNAIAIAVVDAQNYSSK